MNQKQRAKWEQTRAKGMLRFILLNTVLFGGGLLIGTSIYDYFTSFTSIYDYFKGFNGFRFEDLYIKVPIYLVGGLVFGVAIWLIGEYKYKKDSGNTSLE